MSAFPSPLKSPVPATLHAVEPLSGPALICAVPFMYHTHRSPLTGFCHRMSALPSPLISAAPTTLHVVAPLSGAPLGDRSEYSFEIPLDVVDRFHLIVGEPRRGLHSPALLAAGPHVAWQFALALNEGSAFGSVLPDGPVASRRVIMSDGAEAK